MTTTVLYGDLRTGRITGEIDATGAEWAQVLNDAGSVDQVTVPDDVIRALDLRRTAPAAKTFLAVEIDDRIPQAGPIWSRVRDWEKGQVTLGATGLWGLFDHRKVIRVLAAGQQIRSGADLGSVTLTGADLGEIGRALVALCMSHVGGDLPLVLPDGRPGSAHTENWPGWQMSQVGDQLRQLTKRQIGAPDVAFRPRRRGDDRRFLEWVMQTGTAAVPQLSQVGKDWIFDTTTRKSPVLGISTDEDAQDMGMRAWITGIGSQEDTAIGTAYDPTLVTAGWPLLEVEDSRDSDQDQGTVDGYASQLTAQSARPVEVFKVTVHRSAASEVSAGDYCQLITRDDPWVGTINQRMRVQKKAGDLSDRVTLDMFPLQAVI